jgi:hypothetical protein
MKMVPAVLMCFALLVVGAFSAQTKQSDREFAGLKGPVKSVLTERTDAKLKAGRIVESNRRNHEYTTFHPGGTSSSNKHFHWETGEVFETHTYSQIDGDKISKIEMGSGAITGTITEVPSDTEPVKPSDPRYDYKFKYKFDNAGRISEEAWWQSDGDLWLRYVYEYAPGERRELVYDKDGTLNQKYIYKLDPKGNEIEMIAYDPDSGRISGKERYEYLRFDRAGNWTKRIEYEAEGDKASKFKSREVKYRTVTYY